MSCLEVRETPISDPQYGFMGVKTFYAVTRDLKPEDAAMLSRSIATADLANEPAPKAMIVFELGRLRAMTKAKAEDQQSTEFLLACYTEDMREYPADVVREACRKWARTEKFFPAWTELKDVLDALVGKRRRLRDALRRITVEQS